MGWWGTDPWDGDAPCDLYYKVEEAIGLEAKMACLTKILDDKDPLDDHWTRIGVFFLFTQKDLNQPVDRNAFLTHPGAPAILWKTHALIVSAKADKKWQEGWVKEDKISVSIRRAEHDILDWITRCP